MSKNKSRFDWQLGDALVGDRAVAAHDTRLTGRRVALMVCGGIAACTTPMLARALRKAGADVHTFVTPTALQFVTEDALQWCSANPVVSALDGRAQHLELGRLDAFLVAPATYSTIGKLAAGIADNAVTTTLASALGLVSSGEAALLMAPTMHGSMVNAVLRRNLATCEEMGCLVLPPRGEDGKAKLPQSDVLVSAVADALSHVRAR